jgi:CDP-2,3-bis-(O-geranylgeranyl)-sn-glycerol synthase
MGTDDLNPAACAAFLMAAFTLAGLCQAAWLGSGLSRRFALPLDGGRTWRGRRLFGDNKTARGFMVMVPATALAFASLAVVTRLASAPVGLWPLSPGGFLVAGFWAGLGFMVGELPNSFIKRQLGIAPGSRPAGSVASAIAFVADRLDSVVGALVVLSLVVAVPWRTWLFVLVAGPALHMAFSVLVFRLGGKARAA